MHDDRIFYNLTDTKETSTFVREYDDIVRNLLKYHKEPLSTQEVVFLSDNGSAFRNKNGIIVEQMGHGKHLFYSACVHQ